MLERRQQELDLVRAKYGELEVSPNLDWMIVKRYILPEGWSKSETQILVLVGTGYPVTAPDNFYTDNDLRLANGSIPGSASPNQSHVGRQWLQFSHHVESGDWKPHADLLKGHNLLTFLMSVEQRLGEAN